MFMICDQTHGSSYLVTPGAGEGIMLHAAKLMNRAELWLSHINFQHVACAAQITFTLADVLDPDVLTFF